MSQKNRSQKNRSHEIRLATPADSAAVRVLVRAAYSHYVARIGREPGSMGDDYDALIRAGRVHVIGEGGQILGLLVLLPEPDAMLLDNVAVDPAHRGSGVGRALLQWAEQTALDAGYSAIRLYTNEAMTENISLYSRIGYVETHRGEEKGLKRVYMTKRLR
ncbi:acetyltransferase [Labrys miyagiensis]|uniref:Acetyltransferase n=1 Tax=Labrys miyagiensis TaxID=346912 RepID=A0ABQ6CK30_9HYPH|nr:GNAT family N-acetyltransferase [Labrys miyagiensis]GLS19987.1 acetyltransferase [Labrys miyagiensis]